jgi:hypothetical protein
MNYRDIGDMGFGRQLRADSRDGPKMFLEDAAQKPGVLQNTTELAVEAYKRPGRRHNGTQEPRLFPQAG